jgi:hypothetical protein
MLPIVSLPEPLESPVSAFFTTFEALPQSLSRAKILQPNVKVRLLSKSAVFSEKATVSLHPAGE